MCIPEYLPFINEWGFYFDEKDGEENRIVVLKDLVEFLSNSQLKNLVIDRVTVIGGEIYGSKEYKAGERIITSKIVSIIRMSNGILRVNTSSGGTYFLRKGGYNSHMAKILCDAMLYERVQKKNSLWIDIQR